MKMKRTRKNKRSARAITGLNRVNVFNFRVFVKKFCGNIRDKNEKLTTQSRLESSVQMTILLSRFTEILEREYGHVIRCRGIEFSDEIVLLCETDDGVIPESVENEAKEHTRRELSSMLNRLRLEIYTTPWRNTEDN